MAEASPSPGSKRKGAPPSSGTHSETFDDDACIQQVQVCMPPGQLVRGSHSTRLMYRCTSSWNCNPLLFGQ